MKQGSHYNFIMIIMTEADMKELIIVISGVINARAGLIIVRGSLTPVSEWVSTPNYSWVVTRTSGHPPQREGRLASTMLDSLYKTRHSQESTRHSLNTSLYIIFFSQNTTKSGEGVSIKQHMILAQEMLYISGELTVRHHLLIKKKTYTTKLYKLYTFNLS